MPDFRPVGGNLPPRRNLTEARDTRASDLSSSIVVPDAKDRLLELFEREQLPADVNASLGLALNGELRYQILLFQAMIDTWPRLQKGLREVALAARKAPWEVEPYSLKGEEPTEQAQALADEVYSAIWSMRPDMARGLKGFEGLIEALCMAYFMGHAVIEPIWDRRGGKWVPVAARVLPGRFFAYPSRQDGEDRLMLDAAGGWGTGSLEDFPDHRFLVAINSGHLGHEAVAAPLRALAGYWLAAVFGLKWFLQYTQLFGVPFRWAEGDPTSLPQLKQMLKNVGTQGWGAFPAGTKLNFLDSAKGGASTPQRELIRLADEQCDIFILGQTLTSSQGDKGSQSLGNVHLEVRRQVISGICDFVGEVLTHQLVPAYVRWNYGEKLRPDMPGIWARFETEKDEKSMAERDQILGLLDGKIPVAKQWLYERHGLPMPAEDDELFQPPGDGAQGDPATGRSVPHETDPEPLESIEAADAKAASSAGLTVDQLSNAVLEGLTGVSREWLRPVRPFFERLAALAMSKTVSDEDFAKALDDARAQLPGLFDQLDTETLEQAFEAAIGSAMLAGSVSRYE